MPRRATTEGRNARATCKRTPGSRLWTNATEPQQFEANFPFIRGNGMNRYGFNENATCINS